MGLGYNFMFDVFPFLFVIIFITVFSIIIYSFIKRIKQDSKNNNSPRITVDTVIVGKRNHIRNSVNNSMDNNNYHTYTKYYATFEVESGDRMELEVPECEYGLLAENDRGKLTFQGTKYISFDRMKN